ncbi:MULTISPECIES: hypothetical protein [Amycolatopsis]|uniref:Uncharacterized protein n=2 Tax=Amycolatopsis TaxID=1813 RepID=A0A229TCI2_9PSEU|nr:hypothetical protein [Amycolatopsis vastitatis]OXM68439.1 hypothetical protein CF165_13075 [Amycolatopsis vastitatis]
MNRIELAAEKLAGSMVPLQEVTPEQPVVCTPVVTAGFAAFGIGYYVAKAFGPSEEASAEASGAGIEAMSGNDLIQFRRTEVSA